MWVKTGVTKDGAITGMHFRTLLDGGGYGSYGVASTYYTGALQTVTYQVPRYKFQGARAFTNKPPCGPKRGHGTPQPRFALEVQLDKLAEQIGMDPAELRLKHLQPPDSLTANYLRVGSMGLGECIRKVTAGAGWKEKFRKLPPGQGVGLACSSYLSGAGLPIYWNHMPHSGVQLKCDRSGGVTIFCGSTDIGQGLGLDPRLHRGRSAGRRSVRHADRHRRHRSHSGGPGELLVPRHPDERQRRAAGSRAGAGDHHAARREAARRAGVPDRHSPAAASSTSKTPSVG